MRATHLARSAVCAFLCVFLSGCASWPFRTPGQEIHNPVPDLREVSVIPVSAANAADSELWTQRLEEALLLVDGVQRVRVLAPTPRPGSENGAPTVRELAEETQCLLELKVLSFDPYFPPSARIEANFYLPPSGSHSSWDPVTMDRLGTSPVSTTTGDRGPWFHFQRSYRADEAAVMKRVKRYAATLSNRERGFEAVDGVLRVSERYIGFVLHETLKECFSQIDRKERESNGILSKLLNGGS